MPTTRTQTHSIGDYGGSDDIKQSIPDGAGFGMVLLNNGHTQGSDCGNGAPCVDANVFPVDLLQWNLIEQDSNSLTGHGGDHLISDMPNDATIFYYSGHGYCRYRPQDDETGSNACNTTPCPPGGTCEDVLGDGNHTCVYHCTNDAQCPPGRRCSALGGPAGGGFCLEQKSSILVTHAGPPFAAPPGFEDLYDTVRITDYARWGESVASGGWARGNLYNGPDNIPLFNQSLGTDGGVQIVVFSASCPMEPRFYWENTRPMFAGAHMLLGFVSYGAGDTYSNGNRGKRFASYLLDMPVSAAWTATFFAQNRQGAPFAGRAARRRSLVPATLWALSSASQALR